MTKNRLTSLLFCLLLAFASLAGASPSRGWETVKADISDARSVVKDEEIEIMTAPACIIVSSSKQVSIKVFTILGRLVSATTLPQGVSRLNVGAHGVYIVKVAELTCKVAV